MAGGTKSHNLITQNFTLALRSSLRGTGCQVFMEDVRLAVQDDFHYTLTSRRWPWWRSPPGRAGSGGRYCRTLAGSSRWKASGAVAKRKTPNSAWSKR